uniref:Uncharacterized protein n=1 Tax=Heliothis virescens TaxID=7102 RepID=A0A2A4JME6_HELVI
MTGIFYEAKQRYLAKLNASTLAQDRFKTSSSVIDMIRQLIEQTIVAPDYVIRKTRHDKLKLLKRKVVTISEFEVQTFYVEVVPLECAFDIIFEAHCDTKHGSAQHVYNVLQNKYRLPLTCVQMAVSECLKCSHPNAVQRGIGEWKVSILDVTDIPTLHNPKQQDVLLIVDYHTNFTLLRPLPDTAMFEVSEELDFIFTEYGFPEKIYVPESLLFLEDVIDVVWSTRGGGRERIVVEQFYEEVFEEDSRRIFNELATWSLGTEDAILQLGCVVVPFALNATYQPMNSLDDENFGVPMNMFYRRKTLWDNYYS